MMTKDKHFKEYEDFVGRGKVIKPRSVRSEFITEKLLTSFNDVEKLKKDRPISPARIAWLLEAIKIVLLPFYWYRGWVKGVPYGINGNHTRYMFKEDPSLIRDGMIAVVVDYDCRDMTEISILFSMVDNSKSSRSVRDINRSYYGGHPRLEEYSPTSVNHVIAGLRLVFEIKNKNVPTGLDVGRIIYGDLDFFDFLFDLIPGRSADILHMWRAPVIASIYRTYKLDKNASHEFWLEVIEGGSGSHPVRVKEYLLGVGLGNSTTKPSENRYVMCDKLAIAWNKWRTGKRVPKVIRPLSKPGDKYQGKWLMTELV